MSTCDRPGSDGFCCSSYFADFWEDTTQPIKDEADRQLVERNIRERYENGVASISYNPDPLKRFCNTSKYIRS